jgi:membrane protein
MRWQMWWQLARETANEFSKDDILTQAAALAFYTALGLAPTVLLALAVTSFLGEGYQVALINEVESLIGGKAAEGLQLVIQSTEKQQTSGIYSVIIVIVTVLISASGIFAQFQATMNLIWDVRTEVCSGWKAFLQTRLLSLGMVFATLFLLLVSLVISSLVTGLLAAGAAWELVDTVVSLLLFIVLFAILFRFLPDARIVWHDVWVGATFTAVLFSVGKYLIGLYLGQSTLTSSYGAAGSLVALLVWVYYSSVIVFAGAEVTQIYARHFGSGIKPLAHAVPEKGKSEVV